MYGNSAYQPGFDDVDFGRVEPLRDLPLVALTVAQAQAAPLELKIAGDLFWVTDDSTGIAHVRFNDPESARIPVAAGVVMRGGRFKRVFVDWSAQSGLVLHIVYGSGVQITTGSDINNIGNVVSVGSITAPLAPTLLRPINYFRQTASAALNTIVAPGSNTGGIIVTHAFCNHPSNEAIRMMAKATAPSAWNDAAAVTIARNAENGNIDGATCYAQPYPLLIPAGLGFYEQAATANASHASATYEVL